MAVRQDKVQISIAFLTDESKAFAKLVEDNKSFIKDIQTARKKGEDLTDTIKKMAESGKEIARIPLDKLAPSQLILRAQQLKQVLDLIPRSAPEYKQLEKEYKAINDELAVMRDRTKGVSAAMKEAQGSQGSFFNSMSSLVGRAMVLWFGLQQVISSLFKPSQLASDMEQARIAFTTMLGSVREAGKLTFEIIKTAASTPFETKELIDYAKRLLAMGVESSKVVDSMKRLGDIAAGVGKEKLPQLVLAYGQVAAKTKLAGGELKQFVEAGVPLVAALADHFKVAEADIFKMVETGKVGFKDVEIAIQNMTNEGGKFAGLMGKQAQTTEGLISTLKDNVSLALAAFGEGFNIAFKEILKSSIAFSNGLDREKIKAWGEAVGNALKFVIEFTPALLKVVAIFATFKIVAAAQSAITSFTTALKASETVTLLFNSGLARTIGLQTLLNRLFTASALPFWGAAIAAVALAVSSLTDKMTALTQVQNDLKDAQLEGAKAARQEMQDAGDLFAIIRDSSVAYKTRQEAVNKILELYPKYLGEINTEKELLGSLDIAQQRVNQGILDSAFARIKAQEIEKRASERISREIELAQAKETLLTARKNRDETANSTNVSASPFGGANTGGGNSVFTIEAAKAASRLDNLTKRNSDADNTDLDYLKKFDGVALETAKILNKNVTPSWNYLNVQIDATKKLLTTDPKNEGLIKQLASLEKQRLAEMISAIKSGNMAVKIAADNEKEAEKARKKELKDLKDQYDILLKEDEVRYQMRLLLFDKAFDNKAINESDHNKRTLQTTATHYDNMIAVYNGYLLALTKKGQEGGEEYLNIQKKVYETERKLADARAQLNRKAPDVTEALPTQQPGEKQKPTDNKINGQLTQIQDFANAEKLIIEERFRSLVFGEQQLQIARLDIQRNAYAQQLKDLEDAGLKNTKQYEDINKKKEKTDNDFFENKKRLKDLEQELEQAKMSLLTESFGLAIDILSKDEAARKKNAAAIKAFQTAQVIINGVSEVSKIWAVHGANPILAGILTAVASIRTIGAVTKIASTKFALGGFTGKGFGATDETGQRPVGIVHEDEWVAPKWMANNPQFRPIFNMLETVRLKGYANGGYVSTTPTINLTTPPSVTNNYSGFDPVLLVTELKTISNNIENWQSRLKAEVYRDEYEAGATKDNFTRNSASL